MSDVHNIAVSIVATDAAGRVVACPPIDQLRAAMTLGEKALAALPEDQRTAFAEGFARIFAMPASGAEAVGQALFELQTVVRDENGAILAVEKCTTGSRAAYDKRRAELIVTLP